LLLRAAKQSAGIFYLLPAANSFGAGLLFSSASSPEEIIGGVEKGTVRALIAVENDPFWLFPDQEALKQALGKLDLLLVLDYLSSEIAKQAHIFLPTSTLFETRSSFINQEGRIQFGEPVHAGGTPIAQVGGGSHPPRVYGGEIPGGELEAAWKVLAELAEAMPAEGKKPPKSMEDLWRWMNQAYPSFAGLQPFDIPPEGFRLLPDPSKAQAFFRPPSPSRRDGEDSNSLELLLVDWTFGTEELSSYSGHIHQVEKHPVLLMHTQDATRLGLKHKDKVVVHFDGGPLEIELAVADNMASGVMVLPRHRRISWQKLKAIPAKIPVERIRKI
jgi:NADH-quinone oxidoreductase subunit G